MQPVYMQCHGPDGKTVEAVIFRGTLTDGRWNVRWPDGREEVTAVDDMPPHWIEELRLWGIFGRNI